MSNKPYVETTSAKGRTYYYYRRDGKRIRIKGDPSDSTFHKRYDEIHARFEKRLTKGAPAKIVIRNSFGALVAEFKVSPGFKEKAQTTQRDYKWHADKMAEMWGDLLPREVTRRSLLAYRKTFADAGHARQANMMMSVARLLFNFAIDEEFPGLGKDFQNPAARPKRLKEGEGYKAWPEAAMEKYLETHKDDPTRLLAFMLGLLAGQPRGDVIKRNRTHWNGTEIVAARSKTGEPVWLYALPPLKALIDRVMAERFMMLVTPTGRAFTERSFSDWFREGMTTAGLGRELHFHGLRVTAAELLSEFSTDRTLEAIFGWAAKSRMSGHYRRGASRKKASLAGMKLWEQNQVGLPNSLLNTPK